MGWQLIHVPDNADPPASDQLLYIRVKRIGLKLRFNLHRSSRERIETLHPDVVALCGTVTIEPPPHHEYDTLIEFMGSHKSLGGLVTKIIPVLTGLTPEQAAEIGVDVLDDTTDRTVARIRGIKSEDGPTAVYIREGVVKTIFGPINSMFYPWDKAANG